MASRFTKIEPDKIPRIPTAINGIQVNFCKSPTCLNFGRPASEAVQGRGAHIPGAHIPEEDRDTHTLSGYIGGIVLKCKYCGETPPVKSNLAISEEAERFSTYLVPSIEPSCPTEACVNHIVGISLFVVMFHSVLKQSCTKLKNGNFIT